MEPPEFFDVIIIGGSYAGLSAAMALGRSTRHVLVIDSGRPCNIQTPHSHNFLTHDGETPASISAKAKAQVLSYPTVHFLEGYANRAEKSVKGFKISTGAGEEFEGRKIILATGIKDELPPITGLAACWGNTVVHCPYCHGYEFRNQPTGIIANADRAIHLASLVHNLSKEVILFTNGPATLKEEQRVRLDRNKIRIVEDAVTAIEHGNGILRNLVTADGSRYNLDAVYLAAPFTQHSGIPALLGCELDEHGYIKVDFMQRTTVDGVFACGDNCGMMRSLANSIATGGLAGAAVNGLLAGEEF